MIKKIIILIPTLILLMSNVYADNYRMGRPIRFTFVFDNQDTALLTNTNRASMNSICTEILEGKRNLVTAILSFETDEQLTFKYINNKLTEIKIVDNYKDVTVTKKIVNKLQEIHFQSIALLWDGRDKKAFNAKYFMIQFEMGTETYCGKYPYIQLNFSDKKFSNAINWRQVNENSKQWKEL